MAYDNGPVIKTLIKRAAAINAGEIDKSLEIENKLKRLVDKDKKKFVRPVKAFVTFLNQFDHERVINYFETKTKPWDFKDRLYLTNKEGRFLTFNRYKLAVSEAPEPSNIIWENQAESLSGQRKKKLIAYIAILILLILSGIFITFMKSLTL